MLLNKTQRILLGIILFRLISWCLVRTYFIADEFWQTFEVAHSLAFGYGYQTWEWRPTIAIRSYFYPSLISVIYRILAFFHWDSATVLINSATLFQTFLAILGDLAYWKFLQGHRLIYLILLCRYTCWYTMYSSPRLIVNNLEEILFICSLAAAKKFHSSSSNYSFHFFVSLSFILRPTSAIPFAIIYPYLLYINPNRWRFLLQAVICFVGLNVFNTLVDSYFYGHWTCVPWNFFYVNFLHPNSISSHYGVNHLLWYFINGLPMIFFYRFPFVLLGSLSNKRLSAVVAFTIAIYTLNSHKEFRFLSQILPLLFILEAHGIDWCLKQIRWHQFRWILFVAFFLHVSAGIYFSTTDRQGQISVMHYLRTDLPPLEHDRSYSIDFLLPCHSTPFQNFLHRKDVRLNFLTCEPNLNASNENYLDEADRFYSQPKPMLIERIRRLNSTHLVMFDTLYEQVRDLFDGYEQFFIKKILFNSHIQHTSRHGKFLYVLERPTV